LVNGVSSTGKINVSVEQEGTVAIDISPVIVYGCNLPEVASNIQLRIKQAVEEMTGLTVKEVNVQVKGLSFPREKAEATS